MSDETKAKAACLDVFIKVLQDGGKISGTAKTRFIDGTLKPVTVAWPKLKPKKKPEDAV